MAWASFFPSFVASIVEFVEALTIVLAVGMTINWKSSLWGAVAGAGALSVIIAIFGAAILQIPIDILRFVIGVILILFGLQWLKKSILRYSGHKALHDEEEIYKREVEELKSRGENHTKFNKFGFITSFKGVLLEGLEVAFIVISSAAAVKTASTGLVYAVLGAAAAFVLVVVLGAIVHKPLTLIPENTLKFAVGVIITSFGTFWSGEGLHVIWPLSDFFIIILAAFYLAVSLGIIAMLKSRKAAQEKETEDISETEGEK